MQDDKTPEYIVRDYTAVDKQIEEVARREKTLTDKMRLENLAKLAVIIGGLGLVVGIIFLLISWGIRIMNPSEKTKETVRYIPSQNTQNDFSQPSSDNANSYNNSPSNNQQDFFQQPIMSNNKPNNNSNMTKKLSEQQNKEISDVEEIFEIYEENQEDSDLKKINEEYETQITKLREKSPKIAQQVSELSSEINSLQGEVYYIDKEVNEKFNIEQTEERKIAKNDKEKKINSLVDYKKKDLEELKQKLKGEEKQIVDNIMKLQKEKKETLKSLKKDKTNTNNQSSGGMINVSVFKFNSIKDNNFDTIVTEHRYETSNKKKPQYQNCYAEKRGNTSEKLVLNLGKYINTSFKNDYSNENALNLSSTQWNNYLTYCQWF